MGLVSGEWVDRAEAKARLEEALRMLRHRGPDDEGVYNDQNVWLGHRRLSILDLSSAGRQPMESACGRYVISYNGEIYNFKELIGRHSLDALRSRSDTEVVLRLFAKLGVECLHELNGMFAFAIYDRQTRILRLVRDRFGIKPLYYRFSDEGFAFASEIKGVCALSNRALTCDVSGLHEWLYYGNSLGSRTLYEGIGQVLPGCYLEVNVDSMAHTPRQYWTLGKSAPAASGAHDKQGAVAETRRLLEQAVQRQLVSDVPVGVFLSGGVDSSAIAAFAARHYGGRLATYSVGFDFSKDGGELPKARRVADLLETDHHEIHIAGREVGDLVEKMVHHHDMPFSDAANVPLYLMAAQIRSETKVVLQGDGGDELFGGYRRYATLRYYGLLHPLARVSQPMHALTRESAFYHRVQRYLRAFAAPDAMTTMALLVTAEDRHDAPARIFSPRIQEALDRSDAMARFRELHTSFHGHDLGIQMSLMDLAIILPDIYLQKVDRSTMAASLEVRVPFLDHDLADYVVSLPSSIKNPFGRKKWLLKSALRGVIPDDILFGPKTGFSVPYGAWLQTSLKPLFFDHLDRFTRRRPEILDRERVELLFSRTAAGLQNHSSILWKVLNFVIWANSTDIDFPPSMTTHLAERSHDRHLELRAE